MSTRLPFLCFPKFALSMQPAVKSAARPALQPAASGRSRVLQSFYFPRPKFICFLHPCVPETHRLRDLTTAISRACFFKGVK